MQAEELRDFLNSEPAQDVLRMMLWHTRDIAILLRAEGREVMNRAEDEQAAALTELLVIVASHGEYWRQEVVRRLRAAKEIAEEAA